MNPGDQLDGYTVLRLIGRGGYGEVWLCRSDAVGDFRALKFIPTGNPELLEREFQALGNYRKAASRLRSPHLMPVEHVGRTAEGLCYVMPLADGTGAADPSDPAWRPLTLAALIAERAGAATWFTCREIAALMRPVLEALQVLSDAGLVHRDVKPDNILFFGGQPCLGDISLVDEDSATLTRRGTPGYLTPSWYAGGHPDMFAAAATLYTLLTGNLPDRMGRAAFGGPPQGEASLSKQEVAERKRLHAVIRRATDERPAERFRDFRAMADALDGKPQRRSPVPRAVWLGLVCLVAAAGVLLSLHRPSATGDGKPPAVAPADLATDGMIAYNSLTWVPQTTGYFEQVSFDGNTLFQDALGRMQPHVCDARTLDFPAALAILDELTAAVPSLGKKPSVTLARLLLLQCAGERSRVQREVEDPALLVPGDDDSPWRPQLFCRLQRPDKAEEYLGRVLDTPDLARKEMAKALCRRADARARQGKFAEAAADAAKALESADDEPAAKAGLRMELGDIEKEVPAYAGYLRDHPAGK